MRMWEWGAIKWIGREREEGEREGEGKWREKEREGERFLKSVLFLEPQTPQYLKTVFHLYYSESILTQ